MMQATQPQVLLHSLEWECSYIITSHHNILIDSFHHHGFCCSYQEMQWFEHNAAQSHGANIPNLTTEFVQYRADNVNYNIHTLNGHGTFHGMGIIAAVTPETSSGWSILRAKVTSLDIAIVGRVRLGRSHGMSAVTYQKLLDLKAQDYYCYENLDILWKTFVVFGSPIPTWSGKVHHPGRHLLCSCP